MTREERKVFFETAAKGKEPLIADLAKVIWEYAEAGYEEVQSVQALVKRMEGEDFEVECNLAGIPTACVCRYGSGEPRIGILAEYDALPELSQKSGMTTPQPVEGKKCGHGCGHNALAAGAAGAAILLKEYLEKSGRQGTILLYGCPAEESGIGKVYMTRAQCFDELDVAFSWHPDVYNMAAPAASNAYLQMRFDFEGISSHAAAAPEDGRSALDACELMNIGVNYLREHTSEKSRIHYAYLNCGGEAPNIVQGNASLLYYIRAPKLSECQEILQRIVKIAKGASYMTETKMNYEMIGGLNDLVPNETLTSVLGDGLDCMGGPQFENDEYDLAQKFFDLLPAEKQEKVIRQFGEDADFKRHPLITKTVVLSMGKEPVFMHGSTDVGDVSYQVPTAQILVACAVPGTSLHSWQATAQMGTGISVKGAVCAAKAIAFAGSVVAEQPDLIKKAKEELVRRTKGKYVSPLELMASAKGDEKNE